MTSRLFLALILGFAAGSVSAQSNLREVSLKVNGIASGASYSRVIRTLGQPRSRSSERETADFSCLGTASTLLSLRYSGLEVVLLGDGGGRDLKVVELNVTSDHWHASGVRIGATPAEITRRFGKAVSTYRVGQWTTHEYVTPGNQGVVSFRFNNRRLVKITMSETLC